MNETELTVILWIIAAYLASILGIILAIIFIGRALS